MIHSKCIKLIKIVRKSLVINENHSIMRHIMLHNRTKERKNREVIIVLMRFSISNFMSFGYKTDEKERLFLQNIIFMQGVQNSIKSE